MSSNAGERRSGVADVATSHQGTCLDNPVIAEHLEAIHALCREFGVTRLEVFGSVCTSDFDPERSDVDFIVDYPPDYDFGPWLTRFFALQEALADLLGRKVDLVMKRAMRKKYFILSANETRQLLYAV
jgi:predicted nucleotidyltransferase